MLLILILLIRRRKIKRVFHYSSEWQSRIFDGMNPLQFHEHFRMSKEQFHLTLNLFRQNESNMSSTELKLNLLIFLYFLGHTSVLRCMRELFGLPLSNIFRWVKILGFFFQENSHRFIKLPGLRECNHLSQGFQLLGDIEETILAIDGTHIPIKRPAVRGHLYYNRKKIHSLNILAAVDYQKKIRFILTGYGANHDMRVVRNYTNFLNFIDGIPRNFFLIGDKAYRSITNLRIPEVKPGINEYMANQLGKQRIIVENAFGLFKAKFKRFTFPQQNGESIKHVRNFIEAVIIHNILVDL